MDSETFFARLAQRASEDTAVIAALRRSSSYDAGLYPPAFPFIEPYVHGLSEWQRKAAYLAAACWAQSARRASESDLGKSAKGEALPVAIRSLRNHHSMASKSIEQRFIALLDADADELQWRLRHLTSQLSAARISVDWPALLKDLWAWNSSQRYVQIRWARHFWASGSTNNHSPPEMNNQN
jgi:CRISPR system Cascade subunit CasB